VDPSEALRSLVDRLHASDDPDLDLILEIGCGELENLISDRGEELWPEVERLARADPVFRRALGCVWAYDSPEFDRRDQLLGELGEHWPVTVRFIVEPQDFLPEPRVSWRAIEVEGDPPAGQLSRLLREIADWYERERGMDHNPYVVTVTHRRSWQERHAWSQAQWALERAWHRVDVAPDEAKAGHRRPEASQDPRAIEARPSTTLTFTGCQMAHACAATERLAAS
jgi:hypothetical protein